MPFSFRRAAAALTVISCLSLAACSGDAEPGSTPQPTPTEAPTTTTEPSPSATPTPTVEPTVVPNLDGISVEGEYNSEVTVTVPAPMKVDETQTKVLVPGDGPEVPENGQVMVHYTGVNGRTGEVFDSSWSRGTEPTAFKLDEVVTGFSKGLTGQRVGSRVLIAMTGEDGYDAMGGNPPMIEVGDTLVFVVDIVSSQLPGPSGSQVDVPEGLPTVTGDLTAPQVTVPDTDPPTELVVQPLIKGSGAEVAETDTIVADYQMVSWTTGEVLDESYGKNPASGEVSRLIEAWAQGLPGQTVGSRVLLVAPPELAYGEDGYPSLGVEPGDTLVFVVDLLLTTPAG